MEIPLSLVLATYNEAQNIGDCLQSAKGLAREIIVVDGSSTDQTRAIAKQLGAKVFQVANQPIFHINKQIAVEKSRGKWILQLDADERLTPELIQAIKSVIRRRSPRYAGYYLPRKNWFLTRFLTKGGQYPDYVIRLFLNGQGHFPCQSVHEQIAIDGPVGYLKNPLIHLADRSFNRYMLRFNRYTSLDADKLYRQKAPANFWLGVDYMLIKPVVWFLMT